jgi:hypothetical protein
MAVDPETTLARCRRLGHEVPLRYCLRQEADSPCPLVRDCWWERIDIDRFLARELGGEAVERLRRQTPAKPRLARIIETAMKASGKLRTDG